VGAEAGGDAAAIAGAEEVGGGGGRGPQGGDDVEAGVAEGAELVARAAEDAESVRAVAAVGDRDARIAKEDEVRGGVAHTLFGAILREAAGDARRQDVAGCRVGLG